MTRKALSAAAFLVALVLSGVAVLSLMFAPKASNQPINALRNGGFAAGASGVALGAQFTPIRVDQGDPQALRAITLYVTPSCDKFSEWTAESNPGSLLNTNQERQ
jgi:hypothetical protein